MITRPMIRPPVVRILRPRPANSVTNAGPAAKYEPLWYQRMKARIK